MDGAKKDAICKGIGEKIGKLRVERGWSQERLGQEADVKPGQISKIEMGSAQPQLTTIIRICDALDCDYDDILPSRSISKGSISPQMTELSKVLPLLSSEEQKQILNTALAAANYYRDRRQ